MPDGQACYIIGMSNTDCRNCGHDHEGQVCTGTLHTNFGDEPCGCTEHTEVEFDIVDDFIDWAGELNGYCFFMEDETGDDDYVYEAIIGTFWVITNYKAITDVHTDAEVAEAEQFLAHNAGNVDAVIAKLTSDGWFDVVLSECCGDPFLVPTLPEWMFEDCDHA